MERKGEKDGRVWFGAGRVSFHQGRVFRAGAGWCRVGWTISDPSVSFRSWHWYRATGAR